MGKVIRPKLKVDVVKRSDAAKGFDFPGRAFAELLPEHCHFLLETFDHEFASEDERTVDAEK